MRPRLIRRRALTTALGAVLGASLAASLAQADGVASQGLPGIAGPYLAAADAARRGDVDAAARFYAQALAHDPKNADIMERTLNQEVAAGKIDQAIPVARRLEALKPGSHVGTLLLAADALHHDKPAEAEKILGDSGSGAFAGKIVAAWAQFAAGDVEAARQSLKKLQDGSDKGAAAIISTYHLGLLDAAAGQDARALTELDKSVKLTGSETLRMTGIRAGVLARLGKTKEAIAAIKDRLAQSLGDKRLETLLSDLEAGKVPPPVVRTGAQGAAEGLNNVAGFLSQASTALLSLAYAQLAVYLDPKLYEAQLLIAGVLRDKSQYDLANAAYAAIPDDAPEALDARLGRAGTLYDAGQVDASIALLRETVALYPRSIEAHTSLGDTLRRDSRFAEAAKAYDGAIALISKPEPSLWPLYYQRGIALERSDHWDRAEADFKQALKLQPNQPLVLNYLGYSWVEKGMHLDEAQKMIEKAVKLKPDDGYIVDSLGWVQYRLGKFAEAVKNLEKAVELQPVDPIINDHYGDALWMVGRKAEARFQWTRALSFDPDPKEAARMRQKLAEGLDKVQAAEAAAGKPAIIGTGLSTPAVKGTTPKNGG